MEEKRCVFCNSTNDITVDHIPPKSWFLKGHRDGPFVVPACRQCNSGNERTQCDDYVRNILFLRKDLSTHPDIKNLLDKSVRGLRHNSKQNFHQMHDQVSVPKYVLSPCGILIPERSYDIESDKFSKTFQRFIRALYFLETRVVLPKSIIINAWMIESESSQRLVDDQSHRRILRQQLLYLKRDYPFIGNGNNLFGYHCKIEDEYKSTWLIKLYDVYIAFGMTGMNSQIDYSAD